MIIGFDARTNRVQKAGIGYLIDNLLLEIIKADEGNQYKILGGSGLGGNKVRNIKLPVILQKGFNFLWKKFFFPPVNIFMGKLDLFLFTSFVDFPVLTKKRVLMVHDVSFLKFPQFAEKKNLAFLKKGVGPSIKRANKVLTISESAKKEIIQYYKILPEKIDVIHLAPNNSIHRVDDLKHISNTKSKYKINNKYILFIGTIEPRKNIINLIHAYNLIEDNIKKEFQLVIAGGRGWYYDEVFETVEGLGLKERVIFTGYLPEEDVSALYSGASVFVLPSLYEGFGIPILEAFTCGVPVVCSGTSSLPEVGGDAAIYFDPENIDDIKKCIREVLTNKSLHSSLVQKGYIRVSHFSWEKSAKKVLEIINNL